MTAALPSTPLDAEDARILALETGPIRGHTLKLLLVDDAPDAPPVADLRVAIAAGLPDLPRWRQRLVHDPDTPTGYVWAYDPAWSIDRHVQPVVTSGPVDAAQLRWLVTEAMKAPLDRDRPLWRLDVVPRLADGRWALIWKVHHCLADGVTAMRVGSRLLWTDETQAPGGPRPSGRPATAPDGRTGPGLAVLAGYRGFFLREFRRIGQLSPLALPVGTEREVSFVRCGLDDLRAIGKAVAPDVTINDVLLAVVAGGLRHWLAARGAAAPTLKVQIPVSMHALPGEPESGGNRDSFLLLRLPVTEADPIARVRAVHAATRLRKNRQDARAIYALRRSMVHVPDGLRRRLQRLAQGPHEYALSISNVPGPRGPVRVLDRRVDEIYSLAELAPRHALRVAAVSLAGGLFVGLCADPAVVGDLDVLTAGIRGSVDELRGHLRT